MSNDTFSHRLITAMKKKRHKQIDIVNAANNSGVKIGKSHISQYVSGKTIPRENILNFLAELLDTDPDWLGCKTISDPGNDITSINKHDPEYVFQ